MGQKYSGKRKYLYFLSAALILIFFTNCTAFKQHKTQELIKRDLNDAQFLFEMGEFDQSLQKNKQILARTMTKSPADRALFNMGLIYAHYDNPNRNYEKSIMYFKRIPQEFPQSELAEQAKIWFNTLATLEKYENDYRTLLAKEKALNQKITSLKNLNSAHKFLLKGDFKQAIEKNKQVLALSSKKAPADEALFNLGLIYAHYGYPERNYKTSIGYFKRISQEFPQSELTEQAKIWAEVLNVIEKSKQVDIEIEEKKKELTN